MTVECLIGVSNADNKQSGCDVRPDTFTNCCLQSIFRSYCVCGAVFCWLGVVFVEWTEFEPKRGKLVSHIPSRNAVLCYTYYPFTSQIAYSLSQAIPYEAKYLHTKEKNLAW